MRLLQATKTHTSDRHVTTAAAANTGTSKGGGGVRNLHKIVLEKVLQLSLSCRVGQVANVQTTALCSRRRGSLVGGGLVIDRGVAQSVGNVIDSGISSLLHVGSRHF